MMITHKHTNTLFSQGSKLWKIFLLNQTNNMKKDCGVHFYSYSNNGGTNEKKNDDNYYT